jgi:hypothetical protein
METTQCLVELNSTITCPHCGHLATETMPTDACVGFYLCKGCGHCCVFCTYGAVPCPPIQEERAGAAAASCCDGAVVVGYAIGALPTGSYGWAILRMVTVIGNAVGDCRCWEQR